MMNVMVTNDAEPQTLAAFDVLIDARSPGEFAVDHMPGAVNLPVLSDQERAEVGTIYVQGSRFEARRIGAAYVARNVARHLETAMAEWPANHRLLVYCWRGGMRSGAMATILAQVGWRTCTLANGYRTYRRRVSARLYDDPLLPKVVLLDGCTGSGKTEVLNRLAQHDVQTLDLEKLAAHRGSLFGDLRGTPQPSQKLFESRLLAAIEALDPSRPVVLEAESSKIGQIMTPPILWRAMGPAPRIELVASAADRACYLARAYAEIGEDPEQLTAKLMRLPDRPGHKRLSAWTALVEEGRFEELAAGLIETHYDPAYRRCSRKSKADEIPKILLSSLDDRGLEDAAAEVARLLVSEPRFGRAASA